MSIISFKGLHMCQTIQTKTKKVPEFGFCLTFGYHVRKYWDPFWQCKWFLFGAGWFWLTGLLDGGCGAAGMNEF